MFEMNNINLMDSNMKITKNKNIETFNCQY